jgi:hypothetical protein
VRYRCAPVRRWLRHDGDRFAGGSAHGRDRRASEVAELKAELPRYLREAQKAGATAKDLIEWTGYSRRTIFYMLKENTK